MIFPLFIGLTESDAEGAERFGGAVRGAQAEYREQYSGIVSDILCSATKKCADCVNPINGFARRAHKEQLLQTRQ